MVRNLVEEEIVGSLKSLKCLKNIVTIPALLCALLSLLYQSKFGVCSKEVLNRVITVLITPG